MNEKCALLGEKDLSNIKGHIFVCCKTANKIALIGIVAVRGESSCVESNARKIQFILSPFDQVHFPSLWTSAGCHFSIDKHEAFCSNVEYWFFPHSDLFLAVLKLRGLFQSGKCAEPFLNLYLKAEIRSTTAAFYYFRQDVDKTNESRLPEHVMLGALASKAAIAEPCVSEDKSKRSVLVKRTHLQHSDATFMKMSIRDVAIICNRCVWQYTPVR